MFLARQAFCGAFPVSYFIPHNEDAAEGRTAPLRVVRDAEEDRREGEDVVLSPRTRPRGRPRASSRAEVLQKVPSIIIDCNFDVSNAELLQLLLCSEILLK